MRDIENCPDLSQYERAHRLGMTAMGICHCKAHPHANDIKVDIKI